MLERRIAPSGVGYYVSPRLLGAGVRHAFSTRMGGLSPAPFDSLNLGNPINCSVQDDAGRVRENYRLLCQAAGLPDRPVAAAQQVHGCCAVRLGSQSVSEVAPQADALVTDDPGCIVSVRVADCVPILVAGDDGRVVAAVHAGWRGVVAGVVASALREMKHAGSLVAAIGPCLSVDAFEVGPEVAEEFARVFGGAAPIQQVGGGKPHIDLRRAVWMQLRAGGLGEDQIDTTDRCTYRDAEEFFSHRRDHGITGRMAALIAPKGGKS